MNHLETQDTVQRQTKHEPSGYTRHSTKTNKTWTIWRHETQNKDKQNMNHLETRDTEQRQTKHEPSGDTRHSTKTNKT